MPRIVTLFNSDNCGAYLQAWALGQVVRGLTGEEPTYVDTGARSLRRSLVRQMLSSVRHRCPRRIRFSVRKYRTYCAAVDRLSVESPHDASFGDDLVVFGSDEIWNVSRPNISPYPALWGEGLEGGWRISYAPSANGADLSAFPDREGLRASLEGFRALSARDEATVRDVSALTGLDVELVCDPTLLLTREAYRPLEEAPGQQKFMLVYSYGQRLEPLDVECIVRYARDRGLALVSADNWLPWCDESVPCGPGGFLGLIEAADCVVTDTFHGTVLSAIYGKAFASYAKGQAKTEGFLASAGLKGRDPDRVGSLEGCLASTVDWASVCGRIDGARARSMHYLGGAVRDWADATGRGLPGHGARGGQVDD